MKHCHDILLADANEAFCGLLQESIALRENYRVVRTKKGWDILRSVRETPEIVSASSTFARMD